MFQKTACYIELQLLETDGRAVVCIWAGVKFPTVVPECCTAMRKCDILYVHGFAPKVMTDLPKSAPKIKTIYSVPMLDICKELHSVYPKAMLTYVPELNCGVADDWSEYTVACLWYMSMVIPTPKQLQKQAGERKAARCLIRAQKASHGDRAMRRLWVRRESRR